MSSLETRNQEQEQEKNNSWIVVISKETKESQEWKENQRNTQIKLEELRKEIKENWMSINLVKRILENINEIPNENKPFILWGIFSWLNQKWISILWVDWNGKIILKEWKEGIKKDPNIASREDVLRYSLLLNSANISTSDINKALLYRTNSVDEYTEEKLNWKLSTSEYVQRLMEKYKFSFDWILVKDMTIWSENDLKSLKQKISEKVTDNQADKEFLLTYFDDKFYRKWKSNSENYINDYKNISDKNQKKLLDELSNLTPEQKFAVWIKDSNNASQIAKEWTKDPIWTLQKNINADNFLLAIIFWAIWAIFWWKKWFWIWALLWFWIWAWGLAFAGEAFNKSKKDKSTWEQSNESSETKTEIYGKINFNNISDDPKKLELQRIWWDLSKNDNFLKAPTTVLSIFESNSAKTFDEIKTTLEAYGISLTEENKDYYKNIFSEIIKQRKAAWIWEPLPAENIQTYLTRSSRKTEATVAWVAVAWTSWEKGNELINSPYASTFNYRIVDGKTYLIWENGEYLLQNNTLNEGWKEVFKKYEKLGILNEILQIWIPHAERTSQSLLFKWIRSWTTVIPEAIKKINATFEQLFVKIQKWENIESDINMIWSEIEKAENANSIIGSSDMKKIKEIFNNQLDTKDQKLLKIYNTMRYGWWSGNSEWVKNQVAGHLLNQEWFKNIDDILKNPETFNLIKNNNKQKLKELVWEEIAMQIFIAYWKIKIKQEKQREEYTKIVARINEVKKVNKEKEIHLNDYIDLNTEISVMELLKHSLITKQIFEMSSRWDEKTSYTWLYANIVWLAQNKWNDWAVISDENIDNAIDVSSTLAIAAVSIWVWALAARWAMSAARWWVNATRLWSNLNSLWKKWTVLRVGWSIWVEWFSFYQWYNTMNNIIYGNDILENGWNIKEIAKTMAFMWVLRWVSSVMRDSIIANGLKTSWESLWKYWDTMAFIWKMTDKVPVWVLKNTGEILVKWWLITTTSVWLDYVFEWEADLTWEEYLQAVMLVWVMKWVWKITFKKTNWSVTATEAPSPQTTSILQKVRERVSSANIPETAKNHILDIAKAWALWWSAGTVVEWWYNWYSWKFDEQTALQVTWDLISTFTKYAVIWWWLRTIYLWWVWTINWVKSLLKISSTPWTGWVIQSISSNKVLLWTTVVWWVAYNVYSD